MRPSPHIATASANVRLIDAAVESLRPNAEALLLAPSREAAAEAVWRNPPEQFAVIHRLSVAQLAAQVAAPAMAAAGLSPLTQLSMEALTARAAFTLRAELTYFAPVAAMPGFARALAATLGELRLAGTAVEELAGAGEPGADLARLLTLYTELMAERGLADLARIFELASRPAPHPLFSLPLVLLDTPLRTQAERLFLQVVIERAPAVHAVTLAGDALTGQALEALLRCGAQPVAAPASPTRLDHLRGQLFESAVTPAPAGDSFDLFSAAGEGLECVEIARRAARLASQGARFDQMAILLRSPERYQAVVEEALRRAGIPAYFARGAARPHPAGRAFLALLACAAENCSATRFAEYLSLGQVPPEPPPEQEQAEPSQLELFWIPPEDDLASGLQPDLTAGEPEHDAEADSETNSGISSPVAWERLLVDAAVVGGSQRWERRLRGLEAELRKRLAVAAEDSARGIEIQLDRLVSLRRFAVPLVERLDQLPREGPWRVWIDGLSMLAVAALRQPDSVLSVLNELQPMADVGPVGLDEVYGVLEDRLRFLRREPAVRRFGRVFVGSIEEARGRVFETVFLPGLAEGVFPRRAMEDPLLLDEARRALPHLLTRDDRAAHERLLLRIGAAAAADRLVVSYSRLDAVEGRERVPSFYALELARAAEGVLPNLEEFRRRAAQSAQARLGWPAPPDAMQAVDAAEFDLAVLHELLALGVRSARARRSIWWRRIRILDGPCACAGNGGAVDGRTRMELWTRRPRRWLFLPPGACASGRIPPRRCSTLPVARTSFCCTPFMGFVNVKSPPRLNRWTR